MNSTHFSLSPVLRGEGRGEGTNVATCEPRRIATRCPLTVPSPLSTGERVLSELLARLKGTLDRPCQPLLRIAGWVYSPTLQCERHTISRITCPSTNVSLSLRPRCG